jgi:integrase
VREIVNKRLTDRKLNTMKPATKGKRYDVWDGDVRGLGVRVSDTTKRFVLVARFPGSPNPTRRTIGEYPTISLAEAGEKARSWRILIAKGIDPATEEEEHKDELLRRQAGTFGAVAEDFIATVLPHQRKGRAVERQLRREFMPRWSSRPIDSIKPNEVAEVIREAVKRDAIYEAHNLIGVVRRLYSWAINCGAYGLQHSPCDRLRPKDVVGVGKSARRRVLTDNELRALWRATEAMGYPFGPMIRMMASTGQRKSEISEAVWGELNLEGRLWSIPSERMKMDAPHVVPLSDMAMALLRVLPRFEGGKYLFSANSGKSPARVFGRAKTKLDKLMQKELGAQPQPFVFHDIRRTVRTRLSAAPVEDRVREMVIAHAQRGLHKVYDQHSYLSEKRAALDWWAARLKSIVVPPLDNVIELTAKAG